ncbi:MAG: tetratricopeptide repeat protein [Alphaproteobacteria bacterium]|nr:tetratricopeptide repeat protein [Alphaproteobacteria bacterium]
MINFMIKLSVLIAAMGSVILACAKKGILPQSMEQPAIVAPQFDAQGYWRTDDLLLKKNPDETISAYGTKSKYGNYLAGRVAHMRQDFENAAEYYKLTLEKDKDNTRLNRTLYVILTSLGEIDAAGPYALKELQNDEAAGNSRELLAPLVVAAEHFKKGEYSKAREYMLNITDTIHTKLINPMFVAWTYAGEYLEEKAIESINQLPDEPQISIIKAFHKAMIYDYLGNKDKAAEFFGKIIREYPQEVTYRVLEVMTDFYVRTGNKEYARQISNRYNDSGLLSLLLKDIDTRISQSSSDSPAVIDSPQKGLAEALFNIGSMFRAAPNGLEIAQFYMATASYLNPDYEVIKIALANVLEESGLLREANKYYSQVNKNSGSYFIARVKMIENYNSLKEYDAAQKQLELLLQDYPDNTQLLTDLGTIYANQRRDSDAVRVFDMALSSAKEQKPEIWPIYYAAAISYDRLEQKQQAEQYLLKAKELSQNNPEVLNYLGYSWLLQNKNITEAAQMIYDAYKQHPYEGHIIDSIGWVLYRLGYYEKAIEFLENASMLNSGNAVISDHLGDAYWLGGRKNEAVFQWKHALVQKEDADLIDRNLINAKIAGRGVENQLIKLDNPELQKAFEQLHIPHE